MELTFTDKIKITTTPADWLVITKESNKLKVYCTSDLRNYPRLNPNTKCIIISTDKAREELQETNNIELLKTL